MASYFFRIVRRRKNVLYFHRMLTGVKRRLVLLPALIILSVQLALCQPYNFVHYQVENGLSNNAVMCSLQDHNGFMWFGTRDGLNRFDGLTFKVFRNSPEDSSSIGSNAITGLFEDEHNRLWAATEKGIYKYDETTEQFTQLKIAGNVSIRNLQVIGDGIWYISLYNLYRYNEKTGVLTSFSIKKEVTAYCLINDTTLWMSTSSGTIARYNIQQHQFTEYNLFNKSPNSESKPIETIFNTGSGILLVGTLNEGLKSFDINNLTYKDVLTSNKDKTDIIVREIIAINAREYWIASQSGIYILNIETGNYQHLTREQNNPYSLSDNIVHTLCRDREGGIWAGTYFGGINYYPMQYVSFKKYFPMSGANSISGYAVREISGDKKGNLWIGTEDAGLNTFNPETGHFKNFNTGNGKGSVSYSNIHGLLINEEEVWVGTYLHGLDILNVNTGKLLRHYNTANSAIGSNFIYSLFKTTAGEIIVSTDKGLYQYLPNQDNFKMITELQKVFYRTLCEDNEGTIWAGTYSDGVFYYNSKKGKHGQYLLKSGNPYSLPSNLINKIFKDSNGTLWFATEGGLCKYDKIKDRFERITTVDGLPSDVTYSILEDERKNLWISTSKGLASYSPASKKIKVYTKSKGLLTDQFNYSSGYKDGKGQMYFGSVKGMIAFYPDSIQSNQFSPPVFLTGFQVYNKELAINDNTSPLKKSITFTRNITLAHSQSSFSIDFAALSFNSPTTTRYVYKLEGLDKDWTHLETNRKAYFTELNPGTYTFKVSALTEHSGIAGEPATLTIQILPPLWKTWWAYMLYVLAFVSLTFFVIRHFINRSRERNKRKLERLEFEKERENYNDKIEFYINVAHEIRTPLTLIKGPMENIMDRADEMPLIRPSLEIMNRNTDRLLHLSSQLLDFRKAEMNGFRLNFTWENIPLLLNYHYLNFVPLASQKGISIVVNFPEAFYAYIDVEAFNKIMSNLWDNAVKYGKSQVNISLITADGDPDYYNIIFKNDGLLVSCDMKEVIFKSFVRAKESARLPGTGIGLTLSRSLADIHGGSLVMDFSDKGMNTFIVTLPVKPTQAGDNNYTVAN